MQRFIVLVSAMLPMASLLPAQDAGQAPPAAVQRWQDMRFGMFIHWGPVSLKGTEIGWSRGDEIPIAEYDNLHKQFNPAKFDAEAWALTAKAAGMKYLILTTKHHDGFCLWDTKATDFNIMATPFHRDVVKELSAACKKHGIAFGTYYSTCDWHHPAYPLGSPGGRSHKPNPDLKAYDAYLRQQVTELVKNYGPLSALWFDVPQVYGRDFGIPMVKALRQLQPDLMINNRAYNAGVGGDGVSQNNKVGDFDTPEQTIGGFQIDRPWETCMTLCNQWAWKPNDAMKPIEQCLRTLVLTIGGDGNLLFNVGPMPDGRIEERQVTRLKEMGEWVQEHAEAIYGTRGGPFKPSHGLAATRKGNAIYLFVMKEAPETLVLPPLPRVIKSATIMGGGAADLKPAADKLTLSLPTASRRPPITVVKLELDASAMDIPAVDLAK
jgi:alpha-L-fucosidase